MSDPFGEHEASRTHLSADTELALTNDQRVIAGGQIPTNPRPFNEMAGYFGAAGTILNRLLNNGKDYTDLAEIDRMIRDVWAMTNGNEWCDQVLKIIAQYYLGHTDQRAWDAAVKAKTRLLETGYGGMALTAIQGAVGQFETDPETSRTAVDICRSVWFYNAQ